MSESSRQDLAATTVAFRWTKLGKNKGRRGLFPRTVTLVCNKVYYADYDDFLWVFDPRKPKWRNQNKEKLNLDAFHAATLVRDKIYFF